MSEAMAAATTNSPAPGMDTRAVSLLVSSAPESAAPATRTTAPNDVTSCTAVDRTGRDFSRCRGHSKSPYLSVIGGILRQEILCSSMQRLCLSLLIATLALPAAALAGVRAAGDGTLVVRDAVGKVSIMRGSGTIFGHIDQGRLFFDDVNSDDTALPQV